MAEFEILSSLKWIEVSSAMLKSVFFSSCGGLGGLPGVEITLECQKFLPGQANCLVSKNKKT